MDPFRQPRWQYVVRAFRQVLEAAVGPEHVAIDAAAAAAADEYNIVHVPSDALADGKDEQHGSAHDDIEGGGGGRPYAEENEEEEVEEELVSISYDGYVYNRTSGEYLGTYVELRQQFDQAEDIRQAHGDANRAQRLLYEPRADPLEAAGVDDPAFYRAYCDNERIEGYRCQTNLQTARRALYHSTHGAQSRRRMPDGTYALECYEDEDGDGDGDGDDKQKQQEEDDQEAVGVQHGRVQPHVGEQEDERIDYTRVAAEHAAVLMQPLVELPKREQDDWDSMFARYQRLYQLGHHAAAISSVSPYRSMNDDDDDDDDDDNGHASDSDDDNDAEQEFGMQQAGGSTRRAPALVEDDEMISDDDSEDGDTQHWREQMIQSHMGPAAAAAADGSNDARALTDVRYQRVWREYRRALAFSARALLRCSGMADNEVIRYAKHVLAHRCCLFFYPSGLLTVNRHGSEPAHRLCAPPAAAARWFDAALASGMVPLVTAYSSTEFLRRRERDYLRLCHGVTRQRLPVEILDAPEGMLPPGAASATPALLDGAVAVSNPMRERWECLDELDVYRVFDVTAQTPLLVARRNGAFHRWLTRFAQQQNLQQTLLVGDYAGFQTMYAGMRRQVFEESLVYRAGVAAQPVQRHQDAALAPRTLSMADENNSTASPPVHARRRHEDIDAEHAACGRPPLLGDAHSALNDRWLLVRRPDLYVLFQQERHQHEGALGMLQREARTDDERAFVARARKKLSAQCSARSVAEQHAVQQTFSAMLRWRDALVLADADADADAAGPPGAGELNYAALLQRMRKAVVQPEKARDLLKNTIVPDLASVLSLLQVVFMEREEKNR